jgi:xylulokinase
MRIGLEGFNTLGFKAREIRLTGGGSKSPLWQSIAANVMNLPLRIPASAEAAAMGGAIQALWCLLKNARPTGKQAATGKQSGGTAAQKVSIEALADEHVLLEGGVTVKPDKKAVEAYNRAYAAYSKYLGALSPLYK